MPLYEILLVSLFSLCLLALLHSYLFYPWLVAFLAKRNPQKVACFERDDVQLPHISVLMSLFNEERVIEEKIRSLLQQKYPLDKISIWVGSDASKDSTNEIVQAFAEQHPHLSFFPFTARRGKPGVINELARLATEQHPRNPQQLFLITDANVILSPDVFFQLARHFRDPHLAIADAHMVHTGMRQEGISRSEDQYISGEVQLKHHESLAWRKMIGPFGGCYALRSDYFSDIPSTFLVDDFYITLRVFERGGSCINELAAVCTEAVSHEIKEEYRRKKRISTGNFQNLFAFPKLWWPPWGLPNFAYFSHKVLRWLGPFFLLGMLVAAGLLSWQGNLFFQLLFLMAIFGVPLIFILEASLQSLGVHWLPLRHIRYFLTMNLALLDGFFKYLRGVKSNVWQPPKRH